MGAITSASRWRLAAGAVILVVVVGILPAVLTALNVSPVAAYYTGLAAMLAVVWVELALRKS